MPEIQQPDILGNFLGNYRQAQQYGQQQQDRQRTLQQNEEDRARQHKLQMAEDVARTAMGITDAETWDKVVPQKMRELGFNTPAPGFDQRDRIIKQAMSVKDQLELDSKSKEQSGPFAGTGFEASAANIIVRGTNDPRLRSTPEYAIAYANLTTPRVVTDAEGRQMLYRPQVPQGVLPPMGGSQGQQQAIPPQPGRSPQNAPPRSRGPASAGFEPDNYPALYNNPAQPPVTDSQIAPRQGGESVTPIPGSGTRPTEQQIKNASQYAKSAASNQTLNDEKMLKLYLDNSNAASRSAGFDFAQSGPAQAYGQAGDEWVIATLRPESGAVLGPSEIANYAKTYVPQWGDKPEKIAQKQVARARAVEGLRAGLSAEQIIGAERNISSNPNPTFKKGTGNGLPPGVSKVTRVR